MINCVKLMNGCFFLSASVSRSLALCINQREEMMDDEEA